ncbi:flagellar basal body L-ring protein FlgH [Caldovatus aquaticus]|uniref:Flagellar L-ring protein n=1 Tax=Caldovatus aquaticus TaxID=2865671 RepID=A0ABS7F721_9PROT|nr:flagellar basal body L-ring protein FlgH [Caldovatus aquaticus]MBW8271249.1 flagellar basal body L-ring protein FlgH [Caldovatus aquaticus]
MRASFALRSGLAALFAAALAGCGSLERLSRVGEPPAMAPVASPTADPRWRPVTMPMPGPQDPIAPANSLWRPGSRTFLRDQRAAAVGDLVTILVSIQDEARLQNQTERTRENSERMGAPALLGLEASTNRVLPNGVQADRLVSTSSSGAMDSSAQLRRNETIALRVAATVVQILPNGNLVVAGRQQVRVNSELRDLQVAGIIRPQDIASDNTVRHDRLAEARIAYGGRGTLSDVQRPRWGQEVLDTILPF